MERSGEPGGAGKELAWSALSPPLTDTLVAAELLVVGLLVATLLPITPPPHAEATDIVASRQNITRNRAHSRGITEGLSATNRVAIRCLKAGIWPHGCGRLGKTLVKTGSPQGVRG